MKYVQCCGVLLLLNLAITQAVFAGSISDRIRDWLLGPKAQASTLKDYTLELDHVAQACVQCHNGVRASHITVKHADAPMHFSSSGAQVNHPVGMNYDGYTASKMRHFTPRYSLDSNIVLVDGKVSCVSCHRLKETGGSGSLFAARWDERRSMPAGSGRCTASKELAVGPRERDLCLACHIL